MPTFYPEIEDEFIPSKASAWKREQKSDPKVMRRKLKQMEKDNMKELKKDTMIIQQQRQQEKDWRKNAAKRKTYKVGDKGINDEV